MSLTPYLLRTLADDISSAPHDDDSGTSWSIISVSALPVVPLWLINEMRIFLLPDHGQHEKHTAVVQSSYLSILKECDNRVDVHHDPTQPSDSERNEDGPIPATQKARDRWIQNLVDLPSFDYPPGVEQACREHTQELGWKEELDERVLLHDISQAPGNVRLRFWQNYVILYLLLHADHASEGVQTTLGYTEEDLFDALKLAMTSPRPPARPKGERAQVTSLLRALYTLAGGAVNRLYEVSGDYTAGENRELLRSIFGTLVTSDFEDHDAEQMQRQVAESPIFSDITLSVQNLEHLITQMRGCLYLGYPPDHLYLPSQVLSGLTTEQVNMFRAFLSYTYQQIPALNESENNILMLLIWGQRMENQISEALQQWIDSDDARKLRQGLLKDVQGEQLLEQFVITMAALMSFPRLRVDADDDRTEPVYQSFLYDVNMWATGLPLGHSDNVVEMMVFALIQVLEEDQFRDLAGFLETAWDRNPPRIHLRYGLCHEYIRSKIDGRTIARSHSEAMKIFRQQLIATVLCPLFGSLSTSIDQTRDISRLSDSFARVNRARCQDPGPECYKLVRVSDISTTVGKVLVSLLRSNFEDFEVPSFEHLSDGSWEIAVLKSTLSDVVHAICSRIPAAEIDLAYNPLEPTTKDLEEWTYVNAAELNRQWFVERALRIITTGTADTGMTLAACIYSYHLKILVSEWRLDLRTS